MFFKILSITSSVYFLPRSSCLFITYGKCALPLRVIGELETNMWKPARDKEQVREGEGAGVQTVCSRCLGTFGFVESPSPSANLGGLSGCPAGLRTFKEGLPLHPGRVLCLSPASLGPEWRVVVDRRV